MLVANLLVLGFVGGLVYAGAKALSHYEGARNTSKPSVSTPSTPVGMLATVDAENRLSSITLFVMRPAPSMGGSLVSVPISSDTSSGVGDRISLADVYAKDGAEALARALENTMGITIDASDIATPEELQTLVRQLEPITVTLPQAVSTTSKGQDVVLYPAGELSMSAFEWSTALNARIADETERTRRPTIEALWAGVAKSIGTGAVKPNSSLAPGSFDLIANRVFAGTTAARGLPANRFAPGVIPAGSDIEQLDIPETVLVIASIAPSAMSAPNPGLVYRLEAPPGSEAQVKYAIQIILYLHGNVHSVYLNGPSQSPTLMYMYDQRFTAETIKALKIFGNIQSMPSDQRIEGVDVVLKLGSSYLDSDLSNGAMPSTTTTLG
jgi:hypothetical protein